MKKGLIFATTLAMALGVGVAVGAHQAKAARVEAALASGTDLFVRLYNGFFEADATAFAGIHDTSNEWHEVQLTDAHVITTKAGENLYKVSFEYDAKDFQIQRKSTDGSEIWGYTGNMAIGYNNLFVVSGYESGQYMTSYWASATVNHITIVQPDHGSISVLGIHDDYKGEGEGYYYSDWTIALNATADSGYQFVNWTNASGVDWEGDDKDDNPVILYNISGEFGVSAKFEEVTEHSYKLMVASQSGLKQYDFVEVDKGEYDKQYKAVIDVEVSSNLMVSEDGKQLTLVGDKDQYSNVMWIEGMAVTMFAGTGVDCYLKLKNDEWSIYVGGRQGEYVALYSEGPSAASFVLVENPNNVNEIMATNVTVAANSMFIPYRTDFLTIGTVTCQTEGVAEKANTQTGPSTFMEILKFNVAGTYNIYMNKTTGNIYVGDLSSADLLANAYAETFLTTLSTGEGAVCNAGGNTNREALDAAWASLKTAFETIGGDDADLKAEAQGILRIASKSTLGKVGQFATLYDYIVEKYGSNNYEDFVNRYNGNAPVVSSRMSMNDNVSYSSYIVVTAAIAAVATISLGVLIVLKKKHEK